MDQKIDYNSEKAEYESKRAAASEAIEELIGAQHKKTEAKLAAAEAEIARLQELIDAAEGMQDLETYQEHARAAGIELQAWIKLRLAMSLKYNSIPVTAKVYKAICKVASRRCTTLVKLTQTVEVEKLLMNAIDNQII